MSRLEAESIRKNCSGFTMIELMVVVAIVALVSAAVVPSFSLALQRERQRTVANYVVQSVYAARSRAVRTGRCHRITIDLNDPMVLGGDGGRVRVFEYLGPDSCSTAVTNLGAAGNWNQVFIRQIGAQVGADVALNQVNVINDAGVLGSGNTVDFLFEATGEIFINDAFVRIFTIRSYDAAGVEIGPALSARVSSGGSVGVRFIRVGEDY